VEITLLRHATLLVRLNGKTLLVDPMFDPPGARPPVENTPNDRRNPLVPLPDFDPGSVEAILVTHTHADHLEATAVERLPKDLPLFCQPEDEGGLRSRGFSDVRPFGEGVSWDGVEVFRTGGRHGTGEIGAKMAPVSGFVLRVPDEPALYVAGDTIWCPEVEAALDEHEPRVVVVNAGAARFNVGDPITMTAQDVARVCRHAPETAVVAVHMEAINHCLLARDKLRSYLEGEDLSEQTLIPGDGERISF
jgi:L-ascorbate metabolism protein UlaG (beta-lactamase superfamily)